MICIRNQQRKIQVNQQRIERTIRKILRALTFTFSPELSLLFVNDERIRQMNFRYRGIDMATDILSFPAKSHPLLSPPLVVGKRGGIEVLGDIMISLPAVMRNSKERGLTLYEDLDHLLIHGILHLFGYTHESENEARKMRKKEREIKTLISKSRAK